MKNNKGMKRVVIVSFDFPPMKNIGSIRMGRLTCYLSRFGWEPIVITAKEKLEDSNAFLPAIDESKVIRLPYFSLVPKLKQILRYDNLSAQQESTKRVNSKNMVLETLRSMHPIYNLPLIRTSLFEPRGWYSKAVREGKQLIDKSKPDIIFSSYYPSVSHLVASQLQKYAGIPWVAEFKDPWALNQYMSKTQPFQYFEEVWEKRVIKNSTLLVAISKPVAQRIERFHSKSAVVIPDGFDEDDYKTQVPLTPKFTITHTGVLYPDKRNPESLFQAISQLYEKHEVSGDNFEVRFFGDSNPFVYSLVEKYNLAELVKLYGTISHTESVKRQKESSVLLLLTWNDPREWGYPGKIYEYFGAGRPILASAYKGGQIEDLLIRSGCGVVANQASEIKNILNIWLREFRQFHRIISNYNPDDQVITDNTWPQQARKLSEVLEMAKGQ